MTRYVTVSAKVPVELKEKTRKLGIKTSQVVRRALEQEVKKQELRKIQAMIEELQPILAKISIDEVVKSIRQDREQR